MLLCWALTFHFEFWNTVCEQRLERLVAYIAPRPASFLACDRWWCWCDIHGSRRFHRRLLLNNKYGSGEQHAVKEACRMSANAHGGMRNSPQMQCFCTRDNGFTAAVNLRGVDHWRLLCTSSLCEPVCVEGTRQRKRV